MPTRIIENIPFIPKILEGFQLKFTIIDYINLNFELLSLYQFTPSFRFIRKHGVKLVIISIEL